MFNLHRDSLVLAGLLLGLTGIFVWSAIEPADLLTWFLESFPVMLAVPLLAAAFPRFRFTLLVYVLIWVHAVILLVGAHYTYAQVPLFNGLRDSFDLARNYYDRVGHIAQGFVPAMVAREILLRLSPLRPGKWLFFIVLCVCLAISAFYELIEWWVALATGIAASAFLATQGDVWDTQWDMALALAGALTAQLMLARVHDRAIAQVTAYGRV